MDYSVIVTYSGTVALHLLAALTGLLTIFTPERLRKMISDRLTGDPPRARLDLPAFYFAIVPWLPLPFLCAAIVLFEGFFKHNGMELVSGLLRLGAASHTLFASLPPRVWGLISLIAAFVALTWHSNKRA